MKDKITNYIGLIILLAGTITGLGASGTITLPTWVTTTCAVLTAIGTALIGWYTGKPNGSTPA